MVPEADVLSNLRNAGLLHFVEGRDHRLTKPFRLCRLSKIETRKGSAMRSYAASRTLFSFLEFCSAAVIAVGILFSLGGFAVVGTLPGTLSNAPILGAFPGVLLSLAGLYSLALVQTARAGVDSAEYSQQTLQVARDQLEVSRQILERSNTQMAAYAVRQAPKEITDRQEPEPTGPSYADRPKGSGRDVSVGSTAATPAQVEGSSSPGLAEDDAKSLPAPNQITSEVDVALQSHDETKKAGHPRVPSS